MRAAIDNCSEDDTFDCEDNHKFRLSDEKDCDEIDEVCEQEDELKAALAHLCYGDLYLISKVWIKLLKYVLVGSKLAFIPHVDAVSVQAATLHNGCPERPPKMRASDLPIYDTPHANYKEALEERHICTSSRKKIIHCLVFPYVSKTRQTVEKAYCTAKCEALDTYRELRCDFKKASNQVTEYMRDPCNLGLRRGVVALGAGLGYVMASGKGVSRKIFYSGMGAAAAGMLCFPEETDAAVRSLCYNTLRVFLYGYNSYCDKNVQMRDKLCESDLKPIPEKKIVEPCPKN